MRLLRKPERWMCLPASFAMVLGLPLSVIFDEIGHDGSQIVKPELPEPMCRRGFHPQELIHLCLNHGHAATRVELYPVLCSSPGSIRAGAGNFHDAPSNAASSSPSSIAMPAAA